MITAEPEIVSMPQISFQWTRIKGRLQAEVGDVEYRTWLRQMTLAGVDGDEQPLVRHVVRRPTSFRHDAWSKKARSYHCNAGVFVLLFRADWCKVEIFNL